MNTSTTNHRIAIARGRRPPPPGEGPPPRPLAGGRSGIASRGLYGHRGFQESRINPAACAILLHMSKKRSAKTKSALTTAKPLRIVVATSPTNDNDALRMTSEIELVRSAVLYADQVEVISATSSLLASVEHYRQTNSAEMTTQIIDNLDEEAKGRMSDSDRENFRNALKIAAMTNSEIWRDYKQNTPIILRQIAPLRPLVAEAARQMRENFTGVISESGSPEMQLAVGRGIVSLRSLGGYEDSDPVTLIRAVVDAIAAAIADPDARLLFDRPAAALAQEMIDFDDAQPSPLMEKHAREALVGTGLISRLPAFPGTPLDELLDIREDLKAPLSRYRREVNSLGSKLTLSALHPDSASEVDDLWHSSVDPALTDLRGEMQEHSFIREAARSLMTDPKSLVYGGAGSIVGVGISAAADLDFLGLAAALGASGGALLPHATKGWAAKGTAKRAAAKSDLFYLLEFDRRARRKL